MEYNQFYFRMGLVMIENLKTLVALSRFRTMSEVATHLRVSQSTVSKRIVSLEKYYNRKLIQKVGRRVELTQHGKELAVKAPPILIELRDLFTSQENNLGGELVVGVSEAVLSSWGPAAFAKVQKKIPELHFVF
ncbi:MAG: DNA-binding transcriptional LysR family regulator, partial [Oceanicoccus sp.]